MKLLYVLWQLTWGFLQSLLGLFYMLKYRNCRHERYHGSYVTYFDGWGGGISLGMFIFVAEITPKMVEQYKERGVDFTEDVQKSVKVHEYGHTIQSLILGPFYLFTVGISSMLWARLPKCIKYRKENNVAYTDFWCEKWANVLGEKVTGEKAWDK